MHNKIFEDSRCFLFKSKSVRLCGCTIFAALNEDGKFLLAARKLRRPTCTDYIISLNPDDMSKGSSTYIGKLRYLLKIVLVLNGQAAYI